MRKLAAKKPWGGQAAEVEIIFVEFEEAQDDYVSLSAVTYVPPALIANCPEKMKMY